MKEIINKNKKNIKAIIRNIIGSQNEDIEQEVYIKVWKNSSGKNIQKINQWVNTDHMCQKWIFINENGYYRIPNVNSGLYLDIENGSVDNGAKAVQRAYANTDSQLWEIVETNSSFKSTPYAESI